MYDKGFKNYRDASRIFYINKYDNFLVHGLYYDEKKFLKRELYEGKTRKILLYSNIIASSSNILYSYLRQDFKKLDIGGILVTVYRIISDISFIKKIQKEFIEENLSKKYEEEIEKLDKNIEVLIEEIKFDYPKNLK